MSVSSTISTPNGNTLRVFTAVNEEGCSDPRGVAPGRPNDGGLIHNVERNLGELRMLGGTMGVIMAATFVIQGRMPTQGVADAVVDFNRQESRPSSVHWAIGKEPGGCGHVDNAASGKHEQRYGLRGVTVVEAFDHLLDMAMDGGQVVMCPVLTGEHVEGQVLRVNSRDLTVDPGSDFRYDAARHGQLLTRLANYFQDEHGLDVAAEELLGAATQQGATTLGILAPNLPLLDIQFGADGQGIVEDRGLIPPIDAVPLLRAEPI